MLTGESEAQLGVAPHNSFSHLDACFTNDGLASFSFQHCQRFMGIEGLYYSLLPGYEPTSLCLCFHVIMKHFVSLEFVVVDISE